MLPGIVAGGKGPQDSHMMLNDDYNKKSGLKLGSEGAKFLDPLFWCLCLMNSDLWALQRLDS